MDLNSLFRSLRTWFVARMRIPLVQRLVSRVAWSGGFDWDPEQGIFASRREAWQRNAGYLSLYDDLAPLAGMLIHCAPVRFRWDDRDWNIEFWKGQYDLCAGAEIGIYTGRFRPRSGIPAVDHSLSTLDLGTDTDCASEEDWLEMSFRLYDSRGEVFHRGPEVHWWLTGFKPFQVDSADSLRMEARIRFKEPSMRDAFVAGLRAAGWPAEEYAPDPVDASSIDLAFSRPRGR